MKKTTLMLMFAAAAFASAPSFASCTVSDARVCTIGAKLLAYAGTEVAFVERQSETSLADPVEYTWVAPGRHTIRVYETRAMDDKALEFAMAHEYGRAVNNHGRKLLEEVALDSDLKMSDAALMEKYEFHASAVKPSLTVFTRRQLAEANAFAVAVTQKAGELAVK